MRFLSGVFTAVLAAVPGAVRAQENDRFSADVVASAGYSNNPFTLVGDDTESALVSVDLLPRYQRLTERSALTLSGAASFQRYLRRYSNNESYSVAADYSLRASEQVTAHTRLDLVSAVIGANNNFLPSIVGAGQAGPGIGAGTGASAGDIAPGANATVVPLTPFTDIGLFGLRNRRRSARLGGDTSIGMSAQDSLSVSGYGEIARYSRLPELGDYEAYGATLGYSRRLSERLTAGLRGSVSNFNYKLDDSDSRVFSVEATGSARLSEIWTADGAVGVTFVDSGGVRSTRQTSLSGSANLCRRGELSTLCIQGARQVTPTGLVGSQYVTTVGANWSRRLDERENVSLNGNYSNVGSGDSRRLPGDLALQTEYAQAVAGYDRQINRRLRFVASVNYRRLFGDNEGRPEDFGGQLGISYRIGDPQ
ncbi:hypothetical protein [uncultured Sphingomonas sp.]|uniref:hypothetical protein n=1 Tax=uncultured Sphingomonas sp. TaxID=158754 RepID=UPI0035CA8DBF